MYERPIEKRASTFDAEHSFEGEYRFNVSLQRHQVPMLREKNAWTISQGDSFDKLQDFLNARVISRRRWGKALDSEYRYNLFLVCSQLRYIII
jgi:hypothetical protein